MIHCYKLQCVLKVLAETVHGVHFVDESSNDAAFRGEHYCSPLFTTVHFSWIFGTAGNHSLALSASSML